MNVVGTQHQVFATLNIEYSTHLKCNDAFVSVITAKDKKLGVRKSHDFVKATDKRNRLNFFFNGKEFPYSSEKTIRVVYDNGVEFGTLPSFDLIKKFISSDGPIDVRIGDTTLISLQKTEGLPVAFESAKKFCLQKIR